MAMVRFNFVSFCIGLSLGLFICFVTLDYQRRGGSLHRYLKYRSYSEINAEYVAFDDGIHGGKSNGTLKRVHISDQITKVRVLCWIMTSPKTLVARGTPIKETWGKRCDKLLFMSSKENKSFPAIGLNVTEGYRHLWQKTRAAWQYVYDHHLNDAEWFLKADDDTYVVVENLKHFCSEYNPNKPYFFGRHLKRSNEFNSGGAGYLFSKDTLRKFAYLLKNPAICNKHIVQEDVGVGECLKNAGVHPGDSRDSKQRERFHPLPPEHHLVKGYMSKTSWLYKTNHNPVKDGPECCSDHSITFHYISPNMMHQMEYFVYHLRPYGLNQHND